GISQPIFLDGATSVSTGLNNAHGLEFSNLTENLWSVTTARGGDPGHGGGNSFYNREHSWPKSYGFPNDNAKNYPYTDCHALFLCDSGYNSSRSNKPYRFCSVTCKEKPTVENGNAGGETGVYPGNSNWTSGAHTEGGWETWKDRRGDVARALFYLDVRYEGGKHGKTNAKEPDLILTDDVALGVSSTWARLGTRSADGSFSDELYTRLFGRAK
ncbi:MAG: endonuclease, partial [Planctomycetes bacterium]|nr:endonuclease [Planctomycetota bacterium]